MKIISDTLTGRESALLTRVLAGDTIRDAAKACDIPESTAYAIASRERFREELRRARGAKYDQITSKLTESATRAIDVLVGVMDDTGNSAGARVAAAKALLEHALRGHLDADADDLIAKIESRLAALDASTSGASL